LAAAQAAHKAGDLGAIEEADAALEAAALREKEARRVEALKPQVKGGGRTIALRTVKSGKVADYTAFGRWVWTARATEMRAFLDELAIREGKAGTTAPGLELTEEKVAV